MGKLFIISGASGVGKSTVLKKVFSLRSDLQFSVSATTRLPRPGEVDGVHYYFVSKETFEQMLAEDAFLEHSAHAANYYGTPKQQLEEKLKFGDVLNRMAHFRYLKRERMPSLFLLCRPLWRS